MEKLPFDIVIEILARVPVKDVLRFKSVCKSWRSLIQDERFIRKHTTHAPPSPSMILFVPESQDPMSICTYEDRKLELVLAEPELNNGGDKSLLLEPLSVSHCNGLLCLQIRDRSLAIWNPVLRELRVVPNIKQVEQMWMVSFGYDQSIQDHKIVLIPPFQRPEERSTDCSKAKVLTLKSSVIRTIDLPSRSDSFWIHNDEGILVGENIFWLLTFDEFKDDSILTFSLVSETFNYCTSLGLPFGLETHRYLKALRGSLCTVERPAYYDDIQIWRADHDKEDNGVIKSWSIIFRLMTLDIERTMCRRVDIFRLAAVINQAGLLLVNVITAEGNLERLEYNSEEATISKVETSLSFNSEYIDDMVEYIPSLVHVGAY